MYDGVIIRYGEVFLKRGRRRLFLETLKKNIRRAVTRVDQLQVRVPYGRFLLSRRDDRPIVETAPIVEAVQRVFGVSSVSPCFIVERDLEAIKTKALSLAQAAKEEGKKSFRVDARRADKQFPLNSVQINSAIGEVIARETSLRVSLEDYDYYLGVEIRRDEAWLFEEIHPGRGGLPVGANGKVLLLLSGGIDSPVAGFLIMKRGSPVDFVYFHSPPYTSPLALEKVKEIVRVLAAFQGRAKLHVVKFTEIQERIVEGAPREEAVILYRRSMLRLSERIARESGILALATGESLGQVASQTIENLYCIHKVTDLPVLQPCVGLDKREIIETAREIKTYEISIRPYDDCCSLFVAKHPELKGDPEKVEEIERSLLLESVWDRAFADREVILIE